MGEPITLVQLAAFANGLRAEYRDKNIAGSFEDWLCLQVMLRDRDLERRSARSPDGAPGCNCGRLTPPDTYHAASCPSWRPRAAPEPSDTHAWYAVEGAAEGRWQGLPVKDVICINCGRVRPLFDCLNDPTPCKRPSPGEPGEIQELPQRSKNGGW